MTNFEKYKKEIKEVFKERSICGIRNLIEHNKDYCILNCRVCRESIIEWLELEYKEPEVDWSKVKVDTPILVSNDGVSWKERHFAKYEGGKVFCFCGGATSWSNGGFDAILCEYAKLAEEREE